MWRPKKKILRASNVCCWFLFFGSIRTEKKNHFKLNRFYIYFHLANPNNAPLVFEWIEIVYIFLLLRRQFDVFFSHETNKMPTISCWELWMEYDFTEWQPNKCIVLCGFFTHFVRCGPHVNEKKINPSERHGKQKREKEKKKNTHHIHNSQIRVFCNPIRNCNKSHRNQMLW